jgi:hypothetical protein
VSEEAVQFAEVNFGTYRMSPQVDQLFTALAATQGNLGVVVKDKTAKIKTKSGYEYEYHYADLGSVFAACKSQLASNGLCVIQPASTDGPRITVTTILAHSSGQWIASDLCMVSSDMSPQTIGGVITYGRRYGYSSMMCIASEEDDDGKSGSDRHGDTPQKSTTGKPLKPPARPVSESYGEMRDRKIAEADDGKGNGVSRLADQPKAGGVPPDIEKLWLEMGTKIATVCVVLERLKGELHADSGDDNEYYTYLDKHGFKHANDVKTLGIEKARALAWDLHNAVMEWRKRNEPSELYVTAVDAEAVLRAKETARGN